MFLDSYRRKSLTLLGCASLAISAGDSICLASVRPASLLCCWLVLRRDGEREGEDSAWASPIAGGCWSLNNTERPRSIGERVSQASLIRIHTLSRSHVLCKMEIGKELQAEPGECEMSSA